MAGRYGEGPVFKSLLLGLAKEHPQALYYTLRAFVLEKRETGMGQGEAPAAAAAAAAALSSAKVCARGALPTCVCRLMVWCLLRHCACVCRAMVCVCVRFACWCPHVFDEVSLCTWLCRCPPPHSDPHHTHNVRFCVPFCCVPRVCVRVRVCMRACLCLV